MSLSSLVPMQRDLALASSRCKRACRKTMEVASEARLRLRDKGMPG